MKITTIGVDLAKTVFQIHAADKFGRKVHSRKLRRTQMLAYFVRLEPCKVAMGKGGQTTIYLYFIPKLRALFRA